MTSNKRANKGMHHREEGHWENFSTIRQWCTLSLMPQHKYRGQRLGEVYRPLMLRNSPSLQLAVIDVFINPSSFALCATQLQPKACQTRRDCASSPRP